MEAYLTDFKGNNVALPVLLEWNFSYGTQLPCDGFELCFVFDRTMLTMLNNAVRLHAVHLGETVFVGVVDDFEISVRANGSIVTVRGRGLSALLLDNEAEAAEYFSAGLDLILERYVYPFGITQLRKNISTPNQAIVVDSGASCFKVLSDFLWFGSRAFPRFSKEGVLILGAEKGKHFKIDYKTAVYEHILQAKRYGTISEVLVKNKALGATKVVKNQEFCDRGGACRRVVNVPRRTGYDVMRATGEYQIEKSRQDELLIFLKLSTIFEVFAGDTVELFDSPLGENGKFFVRRSRCFADGEMSGTEIILTRQEN